MQLSVQVDTHLRFNPAGLEDEVMQMLTGALTTVDPDDASTAFSMWAKDYEGNFVAPRGFAIKLRNGLAAYGHSLRWDDRRIKVPAHIPMVKTSMVPRGYQEKAIYRIAAFEQGIYEGPPGCGKTISAAFAISKIQQKTLILVNKINIANQWVERLEESLGYTAGVIGDNNWEEKDITVATWQSLWARRAELDNQEWWGRWGAIFFDECHAISSPAIRQIIQRFPAYYRIGLSATPDRHGWLEIASRSIIGEIFCRTTDKELEDAGVLIRPRIIAVRTPFAFKWEGRLKNGKPNPNYSPRKQLQAAEKELKYSRERNMLFARIIAKQRGHACLIHTNHKTHAHELAGYALAAGWPADRVLMLTGDQTAEQRQRVIDLASEGDVAIFSTIGQEALDIPRLDRFFLVWPTKNAAMVKQMVGRVKRVHELKIEAPIVFDFYDWLVAPFKKHFDERRGQYDRDQLPLEIIHWQ